MKAVLFIHGFTAEEKDNRYLLDRLRNDPSLDVRTFFLPGHGPLPRVSLTFEDWIQASEEALASTLKEYPCVTIIGHSMGGVLASILAARHKEVNALILLAPAFYFGSPYEWWKSFLEEKKSLLPFFRGSMEKWQTFPKHYVWEFRKLRKRYHKVPSEITCPTLIIHGTRDPVVPGKASCYVDRIIQGPHQLIWIEGAHHQFFMGEKKEEVTNLILETLKK